MKSAKRFKYVALLLLLVLGGGTAYYLTHKQKLLKYVVPEITKITLIEADIHHDTAFIDVYAIAQNNAPYPINIDSIVCDLSLGGTKLLSEKQYIGLSQLPQQSDTVKFSITLPISRTRDTIVSLKRQNDSTGLSLHATVIYSSHKLSFTKNKEIEVPIPPQFKILKTVKKSVRPFRKDLKADLYLAIINDGKDLDMNIHDLSYKIVIGNDLSTSGKYGKKIIIDPQTSKTLVFPLDFRMHHPASTILKVWSDQDRVPFRLTLKGYIDVGKMKRVPVIIHGSGKLEIVNEEKRRQQKKREKQQRSR
jgi:LEA14-like dessication related protein